MTWRFLLRHMGDGQPHPPQPREVYEYAVSRVAHALTGMPWALTGTLGIALASNRFWRDHADIDVWLSEDALPAAVDRVKSAGYELLARKHGRIQVSEEHFLQILGPVAPRSKYLRLYNPDEHGLARLVDVFAYRAEPDQISFRDPGTTLPRTHPLIYRTVQLSGTPVPIANPHYIEQLKVFYPSEKHAGDVAHAHRLLAVHPR